MATSADNVMSLFVSGSEGPGSTQSWIVESDLHLCCHVLVTAIYHFCPLLLLLSFFSTSQSPSFTATLADAMTTFPLPTRLAQRLQAVLDGASSRGY